MDLREKMHADVVEIEAYLRGIYSDAAPYQVLYDAMNYSLLAGGKRLRPMLSMEVCRMCRGDVKLSLPLGCAVEMVHTYSLIHDDLPAMDNDDFRRGKPTNHKKFGDAIAILAGDGLLTGAFELIAGADGLSSEQRMAAVSTLAQAAGANGMVGGQVLDMIGEGQTLNADQVELLQSLKTGALIRAAAHMGCIAAGTSDAISCAVDQYAQKIGLAFQVRDDILDVIGDPEQLGKPIGSDEKEKKSTFVTLLGVEQCQEWVMELSHEAEDALRGIQHNEFLIELAQQLAQRAN